METADCKNLLHNNITKTNKRWDQRKISNINKDPKKIAVVWELEDRIEKMQGSESYITIKAHKEDFPNKI